MNTAWIFIEICRRYEKGQPTYLSELQNISPQSPNLHYRPHYTYEKVTNWRSGSIQREVGALIKWGLVEKETLVHRQSQREPIHFVPTELGRLAWNEVVQPLIEKKEVWPFNYLLYYTDHAKVTQSTPFSFNPPVLKTELDPILPAIFPLLRDILEERRDNRPWLYALATGNLFDKILVKLIRRRLFLLGVQT